MCNDVDPEHGLHGYQLHVALNDTTCDIMSEHFSQLFCRKADIGDGLMRLRAISRSNASQHARLAGSVGLPWSCETLQGNVQNGCVLSVTLVDFCQRKFWCVGSAVSVQLQETPVCYDYDGEHFLILHQDSEGRVEMQLVKEQTRFVVVSLAVSVAVGKVNKHFGTSY
ncbi:F-box only protein 15-like [Pseudochaenichthys georgianus]|nr:F-box only protein 15-like [Pseudochaenichthys georgianus]